MYTKVFSLFLASSVLAVPLNINLGAYSPALVVGDGEISFGASPDAAKSAAALFETLATGAQAGSAPSNPQGQPATLTGTTPVPAPVAPQAPAQGSAPAQTPAQTPAQATGETTPQAIPQTATPGTEAVAVDDGAAESAAIQNIAKKVLQPITRRSLTIRDIQGFRESLAYAKEAMKNTPAIDIGSEAAGVGIKQNPGLAVPAGSPAAGTPPRRQAKRDVEETRERTGITLLAIAEI